MELDNVEYRGPELVEITFQQPGLSGTPENVTCARTAERFWIGSYGLRMGASLQIPLADLLTISLEDLVSEQMDLAQQELLSLRGSV